MNRLRWISLAAASLSAIVLFIGLSTYFSAAAELEFYQANHCGSVYEICPPLLYVNLFRYASKLIPIGAILAAIAVGTIVLERRHRFEWAWIPIAASIFALAVTFVFYSQTIYTR